MHRPPTTSLSLILAATGGSQVIRDPASTRTVLIVVGLLVAAGIGLLAVSIWFWRTSRPEHPSLGPLEVMGDRRFWRSPAVEQVRQLDAARPDGAEPQRSVASVLLPYGPRPDPSEIDLELASLGAPVSFDDLAELPELDDVSGLDDLSELDDDRPASIDPLLGPKP